jgi:hypothetical protein
MINKIHSLKILNINSFPCTEDASKSIIILVSDNLSNNLIEAMRCNVNLGCKNFACFGINSETIHDALDDLLNDQGVEAITTWHTREEPDDLVDYLRVAPTFGTVDTLVILYDGINIRDAECIYKLLCNNN